MLIATGKFIHKRDITVSSTLLEKEQLVSLPVGALCLRNRFSQGINFPLLFLGPIFERCLCEVDDDVDVCVHDDLMLILILITIVIHIQNFF